MQAKELIKLSRSLFGGTGRTRREKPGRKGKYKTRHMESTVKEHTNLERENDPQKTLSKFSDCYTSEDSLLDNPARSQTECKKKKKRRRLQLQSL